jgi:hypothetical protein
MKYRYTITAAQYKEIKELWNDPKTCCARVADAITEKYHIDHTSASNLAYAVLKDNKNLKVITE